jgi:hypothetical protein
MESEAKQSRSMRVAHLASLLVIVGAQAACTFQSRGVIAVSPVPAGGTASAVEDEVADVVGRVALRHGFTESWQVRKRPGAPCTMERGCIWSRATYAFPSVSVSRDAANQVRVVVDDRHDLPRSGDEVRQITVDIASELRGRIQGARVVIEKRE